MKRFVLFAALVLAACSVEEPTEAIQQPVVTYLTSPYSAPAGVIGAVGMNNNNQWAIWWRSTDSNCSFTQIGNLTSLWQSVTMDAASAAFANMYAVDYPDRCFYCSNIGGTVCLGAIQQGAYSVTLKGTAGADYMGCSGAGAKPVTCFGLGGNDIMEDNGNPSVTMYGGTGADKLRAWNISGGPAAPSLFGEEDNDCIYGTSSQSWRDCGAGSDTSNMSGAGCETVTATTCP